MAVDYAQIWGYIDTIEADAHATPVDNG